MQALHAAGCTGRINAAVARGIRYAFGDADGGIHRLLVAGWAAPFDEWLISSTLILRVRRILVMASREGELIPRAI